LTAGSESSKSAWHAALTAIAVAVSLAVLTVLWLVLSFLSSFDSPGAGWTQGIAFGPITLLGFVLFFPGIGVGVYRALFDHDWSLTGNVVVTFAAAGGGFIVGLWFSQWFLGDGYDVSQSARAVFGYAGLVLFAGGALLAIRIHSAKRAAAAPHTLSEPPRELPQCPRCGTPYDPDDYREDAVERRCVECRALLSGSDA